MIMETVLQFIGYLVLTAGCLGILYVLGKILAMGAKAMLDNDD